MEIREQGPSGIGGWLLLYISTIALFRPAVALAQVYKLIEAHPRMVAAFGSSYQLFRTGEWLFAIVDVSICWFVAWRLLRTRDWTSVHVAIAGMWASVMLIFSARLVMLVLLTGAPLGGCIAMMLPSLARAGGYAGFWTVYLFRSRRVRATYPRAPGVLLADVFT